jgi:hypothetical protein
MAIQFGGPLPEGEFDLHYAFFERCIDLLRDRNDDYGPVEICFNKIALSWSAYKGVNFNGYDVAIMMAQLKLARLSKGHHQDSLDDAAAYLMLANKLKGEQL